MEISEEQYARIKDSLPVQPGNVSLTNLQVLNAILYVAEQGCKWRGLPKRFGRWHTIYMRMNRWACVKKRCKARAVQKMKVGPSESFCKRGLQTAMSCCSQKLWW